jgi:hypothetical protein
MTKKKSSTRPVARTGQKAVAVPKQFTIGDAEIRPEQFYLIPERHPAGPGPWGEEPDKLAWTDAATGLACIILRQGDGTLSGYASVDPGHPLWGFTYDAVPSAIGKAPHRGIDYAELCSNDGPERIRVCHSRPVQMNRSAPQGADRSGHDDKWWFGFSTSMPGDHVPNGSKPRLHREEGEVYRDLGYVFEQTRELAAGLRSVEGGDDGEAGVPLQLGSPATKNDLG